MNIAKATVRGQRTMWGQVAQKTIISLVIFAFAVMPVDGNIANGWLTVLVHAQTTDGTATSSAAHSTASSTSTSAPDSDEAEVDTVASRKLCYC